MQLLIISGFLGAGKTRFIQAMAKGTGRQFVIVENEFAEANVDSKVLRAEQPRRAPGEATPPKSDRTDPSGNAAAIADEPSMNIWELSEGCICCSLNLDFTYSVLTIANTLNPDYLVVEPSGVAHLSAILEQLNKISYERIGLLAPVTIVDQKNYLSQRAAFSNYFCDQVGNAGMVVLSKSEILQPEDFIAIKKELRLADDVDFPLRHYSKWQREDWFKLLSRQWVALPAKNEPTVKSSLTKTTKTAFAKILRRKIVQKHARRADQDLMNLTFYDCRFSSVDAVYSFLERLLWGAYGDVVRFKGFFSVKNEVLHVEGVGSCFEITGFGSRTAFVAGQAMPEEREAFPFVIIGKALQAKPLLAVLQGP